MLVVWKRENTGLWCSLKSHECELTRRHGEMWTANICQHVEVSWNGSTPKSSTFTWISSINQPFWGCPYSGETSISITSIIHHPSVYCAEVLSTLLNNLKVQERQLRICTTVPDLSDLSDSGGDGGLGEVGKRWSFWSKKGSMVWWIAVEIQTILKNSVYTWYFSEYRCTSVRQYTYLSLYDICMRCGHIWASGKHTQLYMTYVYSSIEIDKSRWNWSRFHSWQMLVATQEIELRRIRRLKVLKPIHLFGLVHRSFEKIDLGCRADFRLGEVAIAITAETCGPFTVLRGPQNGSRNGGRVQLQHDAMTWNGSL